MAVSNGAETKKQENGSRVYFEMFIESSSPPKDADLLKAVKRVYSNVSDEWMSSFEKQAIALKGFVGRNKGYEYSRDTGFMPYIEGIAKSKCGVTIKDRWNPADIYMVKKSKESSIKTKLAAITASPDKDQNLIELNGYMRELLAARDVIPISLKAIKKNVPYAKAEMANMGSGLSIRFSLVPGSVKCILSFGNKNPHMFDTGEFAWDFFAGDLPIHGQSRNFQYSVARNLVQTDLTPKGRDAGAKLGKASSQHLDQFLRKHGMDRPASANGDPNIPAVGNWTKGHQAYWIDFYNRISSAKIGKSAVDFGDLSCRTADGKTLSGFPNIIKTAIAEEEMDRSSAGRFSSKLIAMRWVDVWWKLDKKGLLEEWLATLYYGAKKEFGDTNGPFVKIY
jgi:hypothetical protein